MLLVLLKLQKNLRNTIGASIVLMQVGYLPREELQ